jgi:hypothetical protein
MRRRRARVALASFAVLVPFALGSGCASLEGLKSDGRAREVKAPLALWPEYSPAPPNREDNPAALKPVPGVPRIPGGDMTAADPLAVLDADLAAEGRPPPDPKTVRRPLLYDLTDDGRPDLITVVDLDRRTSELRVYSVRDQVVTRVLFVRGVLAGVELAAGHLAVRQPTEDPRYVSVTDYVWNGDSMGLWDLTLDEARKPTAAPGAGKRTAGLRHTGAPSVAVRPSPPGGGP